MRHDEEFDFTIETLGSCKIPSPIHLSNVIGDRIANYVTNDDFIRFRLESKEAVDEDGTVDLSHAALGLYTRGEARREETDASLWTYFLDIARELTSSFNDEGHHWPEMRAARPLWFQNKGEK